VFGQGPSESPPVPLKVITLRPSAEPVPALRYRFFPEQRELIPGNAAIFYHRAIEFLLQKRALDQSKGGNTDAKIYEWINLPIRDLPREDVRKTLDIFRSVLKEVELGTRREFCNWEFDRRDEGFDLLLQDIQEARSLGRLVVLQTRFEIVEGRIDHALHWLKTGFVFSRHAGQGTSLVQALIGMAIERSVMGGLEDLIQAPGTPSLCWALAVLPRPLIPLGPPLEGERYMLERQLPGLRELDSDPWSLEKAQAFSDAIQRSANMFVGLWAAVAKDSDQPSMGNWGRRLLMTSLIARTYPAAKRHLVAEGRPIARVEAMPVIQAVALYSLKAYEQMRDDIYKWTLIPYPQAYAGMQEAMQRKGQRIRNDKQGLPFGETLPAFLAVFVASVRSERQVAAFQAIEAIRLYAGSHGGQLPPSLEAIKEAPVLPDPATGKSFEYKVDGTSAKLSSLPIPGQGVAAYSVLNYELRIMK